MNKSMFCMTVALTMATVCMPSDLCAQSAKRPRARKVAPSVAAPVPARVKVAEGKYELRTKNAGAQQTWEEPWTLFKTKTGFELEEQWKAYKEGQTNSVIVDVLLTFAPGLYPIQARIGSGQSPNQLNCSMTMNVFKCEAGGKSNSLSVAGTYNFFLPSPWLLSSIGRRAPKHPDKPVRVKLVQMTGMSAEGPKVAAFEAQVVYVGDDQVDVAGLRLAADIYEIRAPEMPTVLVWIANDDVVLMMQDVSKPDQRMELVEFKKLSAF